MKSVTCTSKATADMVRVEPTTNHTTGIDTFLNWV